MVRNLSVRRITNGFIISYAIGGNDDPFGNSTFVEKFAETAEQAAMIMHEAMYNEEVTEEEEDDNA